MLTSFLHSSDRPKRCFTVLPEPNYFTASAFLSFGLVMSLKVRIKGIENYIFKQYTQKWKNTRAFVRFLNASGIVSTKGACISKSTLSVFFPDLPNFRPLLLRCVTYSDLPNKRACSLSIFEKQSTLLTIFNVINETFFMQ